MKRLVKLSFVILFFAIIFSVYFFSSVRNSQTQGGSWFIVPGIGTTVTMTRAVEKGGVFNISTSCSKDSDCNWSITNCCKENSGAKWDCINEKSSAIECPNIVFCPEVISSKPVKECRCVGGGCSS